LDVGPSPCHASPGTNPVRPRPSSPPAVFRRDHAHRAVDRHVTDASSAVSAAHTHTRTHRRTWWTITSRSPVLTLGGICVQPTVIYSQYRISVSTVTPEWLFTVARHLRSGTLSWISSGTQQSVQTVSDVFSIRIRSL